MHGQKNIKHKTHFMFVMNLVGEMYSFIFSRWYLCCKSYVLPVRSMRAYKGSLTSALAGGECLRDGADKFLARLTSRCRTTESIVSLERGVCSYAELQVFSCYRGWKKHVRRRAPFQQHRDASCHKVPPPPAKQGAEGNSRHSDRNISGTCTIVCHRQKLGSPA